MKNHFSLLLNLLLSSTLFWGVPEAGDELAARKSATLAGYCDSNGVAQSGNLQKSRADDPAHTAEINPECTAAKRVPETVPARGPAIDRSQNSLLHASREEILLPRYASTKK